MQVNTGAGLHKFQVYTVMQVETYLCLLCSVRKIHFGFPPPATTTYIFLRPRISLTRGQKKDTMLKILRTNFGHGLLSKFAFW